MWLLTVSLVSGVFVCITYDVTEYMDLNW